MKKFSSFLVFLLVLCTPGRATELSTLGQGLAYLRVHALTDAVNAAATSSALVLDLRYARADDTSAATLQALLAGRGAPAGPLFILVSPATPPVLAAVIKQAPALRLGIAGSQPAPQVVVKTDAATDRLAYDALDAGTPADQLISGKIEKERYDEATLVDEFNHGNPAAEPPPAPDPTATKADDVPAKPVVLTDHVLQRAVHLHRALLALKPR